MIGFFLNAYTYLRLIPFTGMCENIKFNYSLQKKLPPLLYAGFVVRFFKCNILYCDSQKTPYNLVSEITPYFDKNPPIILCPL